MLLLLLLFLRAMLVLDSVGVTGFLDSFFSLPKLSVNDIVSVTVLFLNSRVSNFSPSSSCPKSDTSDKVSVTVLFLSSSWSYFSPSRRGLISPAGAPEALLDLSMFGVSEGVTPDMRLDLLMGVAGVVLGARARSSSSDVIVVLLNLPEVSELVDPVSIGTVDALLLAVDFVEISIIDTLDCVESALDLSTTGVVACFLGLPLFFVLEGGTTGTNSSFSCSSEANWAILSSLSDSIGSVDAKLGALEETSTLDALFDLPLLGLPEAVTLSVDSDSSSTESNSSTATLAGVFLGVFLAGVFLVLLATFSGVIS